MTRQRSPSARSTPPRHEVAQALLGELGDKFRQQFAQGLFQPALLTVQQVLRVAPNHPSALGDLALCHLRLGDAAQARRHYLRALERTPKDVNLLDGLTESCGELGRWDDVRQFGQRSLELKDAQTRGRPTWSLPPGPPPMGRDRRARVIAYSLFGAHPRYCETARLNVQHAQRLFPDWVCRFYCDSSVPVEVRHRLRQAGAEVVEVSEEVSSSLSGLMWRFLALDDPTVERVLFRDADSLLSVREQVAVAAWLASDCWFHVMRDWHTHTELMLAGMWGACGGVFQGMYGQMQRFTAEGNYLTQRVVDQHFLRACVWPTVRHSLLTHDRFFKLPGTQAFPAYDPSGELPGDHVGSNVACAVMQGECQDEREQLHWRLVDAQGQPVCSYSTPVQNRQWTVMLPRDYIERLQSGQWRLQFAS